MTQNPSRPVGEEARKSQRARLDSGFIEKYLSGAHILDIGYKGYLPDIVPIVPRAIGVELDYPGYDGRTLPFADGSRDAVFASHCLEHIEDVGHALRDWLRVLRVGGFIVAIVPHQYLYEKRAAPPSRWNADHKRFYTPASLMREIETSLPHNSFRLRHLADNDAGYDYAIGPEAHAIGCYEIELVIEKIQPPAWRLEAPRPRRADPALDAVPAEAIAPPRGAPGRRVHPISADGQELALFASDPGAPRRRRVLVLKLDHFGDFIIGLPALRQLRAAFRNDHIKLVCGGWNEAAARATGLFDDIAAYGYFPPRAAGWDGAPMQPVAAFRAAAAGHWDLAIDLRVDEDTRHLLREVDADARCGIGAPARMGFLDIALPPEHDDRRTPPDDAVAARRFLRPDQFHSRMPNRGAFCHATDFSATDTHLIYGPYLTLPPGRKRATFGLQLAGLWAGALGLVVTLEVCQGDAGIVAARRLRARDLAGPAVRGIALEFDNDSADAVHEFRVHTRRRPPHGRLSFFGVDVAHLDTPPTPRLRRAELHVGEQLSLLVTLIAARVFCPPGLAAPPTAAPPSVAPLPVTESLPAELAALPSGVRRIVIAPVGNSDLRNWPAECFGTLVAMLSRRLDCVIFLIGSGTQRAVLERIAQSGAQLGQRAGLRADAPGRVKKPRRADRLVRPARDHRPGRSRDLQQFRCGAPRRGAWRAHPGDLFREPPAGGMGAAWPACPRGDGDRAVLAVRA